jgi:hypothetical protein
MRPIKDIWSNSGQIGGNPGILPSEAIPDAIGNPAYERGAPPRFTVAYCTIRTECSGDG